jgi:hypothetical protein
MGANGGYLTTGANGDLGTDMLVFRGSGGGGGGSTINAGFGGGAGGGGAGGGAVTLISRGDMTINGTVSAVGGGGGSGGFSSAAGAGGNGGGGAGGGICLAAWNLTVGGLVDNRGRAQDTLVNINGGTAKLFFFQKLISGSIYSGRTYTNIRPAFKGLVSPSNGTTLEMLRPTFEWLPASDPEGDVLSYQIQVSRAPDLSAPIIDQDGIYVTNFTSPVDLVGQSFYWRVRAIDAIGPGNRSEVWSYVFDRTPPVSTVHPLPAFTTTLDFEVSWEGSDNFAGIESYMIFVRTDDGPFMAWLGPTVSTSGLFRGIDGHRYAFASVAVDIAGNQEPMPAEPQASTTLDATPPDSAVDRLPAYQNRSSFRVSWSGIDQTSGISNFSVYVSNNQSAFSIWKENVVSNSADYQGADGHEYRFFVRACDVAGNLQDVPGSGMYQTTRVDLSSPVTTLALGNPSFGIDPVYIRPDNQLSLQPADNYTGVNGTYYIMDGSLQKTYSGPFAEPRPGLHNITFWSVDRAGNEETHRTARFFTDGDAPLTILTTIGPNVTAEGKVFITNETRFELSAQDTGSGVNRTELCIDQGAYMPYYGPVNFSTSGTHSIKYRSIDNMGFAEQDRSIELYVDLTAPSTSTAGPARPQRETVRLALMVSDTGSGVAFTHFRVFKAGSSPGDYQQGSEAVVEASADHAKDGTYTVEFFSADRLGNTEQKKMLDVVIDTIVSINIAPKGDYKATKSKLSISGNVEPGSALTVNGQKLTIPTGGNFTYDVVLKKGATALTFVVIDPAGNTATEVLTASYNPPEVKADNSANMGLVLGLAIIVVVLLIAVLILLIRGRKPPTPQTQWPSPVPLTGYAPPTSVPEAPPPAPPQAPQAAPPQTAPPATAPAAPPAPAPSASATKAPPPIQPPEFNP